MSVDNPPAFPSVCLNDPRHEASVPGMTLRDWFAGQALASLIAAATENLLGGNPGETNGQTIARMAFDMADDMLAARAALAKAQGQ